MVTLKGTCLEYVVFFSDFHSSSVKYLGCWCIIPVYRLEKWASEKLGHLLEILQRVCVCEWVSQLCPTLYDALDCSLPGSSVRGILQARVLEWVAISF